MVSDVANRYFEVRQLDEQIDFQQRSLDQNRKILDIYTRQYDEGLVARTRVLRQQAEINNQTRHLLNLPRQRELAVNAIATLLGNPAGNFQVPVAPLRGTLHAVDVPVGLPSELLSRRPDIVGAEYRVLQAHELVGHARLARLPNINLTVAASAANPVLGQILNAWTMGRSSTMNIPILDQS